MNIQSCANCRWVGCKNYGWDRPICTKYIPDVTVNQSVACKEEGSK